MKIALRAATAVSLLASLSFSSTAAAQSTGFSLNRFEPAERGSEWFTLESLDLRGHGRPALGFTIDGAYRPLATYNEDKSVDREIVRHQIFGHLGASLVLWHRLRLGVNAPIALYQEGEAGLVPETGVLYMPPQNHGFGDVRLGTDLRLFGKYGDAITGALGVQVFLPTGSRADYTGDGTVRVQPRAMVAGDVGAFAYAARVAFQYRPRDANFGTAELGSELIFAGSAGVRVADKKLVIGPELFGTTGLADPFSKLASPLEGIFGFHYTAGDVRFGAGGGAGLTRGYGAPAARWLVMLEWAPRYEEPQKPQPLPVVSDRDKDTIVDDDDACPDTPGVRSDNPMENGCPPDRDKDKVYDHEDACPDVPGVRQTDPKQNGCPPDSDKDGILDVDDACPDVPGIKTDDPKTNGCPDPDRDKDGVLNEQDACPDEPGKPDPDPRRNGCPKAFVQGTQIKILDQVKFATGKADIVKGKDSEEILDAVLKVMNDHPEIKKLRIEGHTDNRGPADLNKTLSAARAAAVVQWLVAHGVDVNRLTSAGFGPDRPIDDNTTEEGRRQNRRVEFHIEDAATPPP
jgi:outer membrane protein OmpA-like peptidoglycan-associated protein